MYSRIDTTKKIPSHTLWHTINACKYSDENYTTHTHVHPERKKHRTLAGEFTVLAGKGARQISHQTSLPHTLSHTHPTHSHSLTTTTHRPFSFPNHHTTSLHSSIPPHTPTTTSNPLTYHFRVQTLHVKLEIAVIFTFKSAQIHSTLNLPHFQNLHILSIHHHSTNIYDRDRFSRIKERRYASR